MNEFYDALETRDPALRESELLQALPQQIAHAQKASTAMSAILSGVDSAQVTSRAALARLPVTRKHELLDLQASSREADPFGGFSAVRFGHRMPRVFASPGTIYEPQGAQRDYWRLARALFAAGFRRGELIHNCFSYHFVPAGSMMETGAHALGCTVFAG
ncbi:MAG: phenylacetate--CoA ligase family protein, partial [Ramlibacter sp.]|nr:phenylacetate--CoA ligase family protein [Ramlibacter sp.]